MVKTQVCRHAKGLEQFSLCKEWKRKPMWRGVWPGSIKDPDDVGSQTFGWVALTVFGRLIKAEEVV